MMKVSDVLIQAKSLIDHPSKWVQGMSFNIGKTAYCASGAAEWASESAGLCFKAMHFLYAAIPLDERGSYGVVEYNDHHTHADVMALFDRAIQLAKHDEERLNKGDNNDDRQGSTTSRTKSHQEAGELVTV